MKTELVSWNLVGIKITESKLRIKKELVEYVMLDGMELDVHVPYSIDN